MSELCNLTEPYNQKFILFRDVLLESHLGNVDSHLDSSHVSVLCVVFRVTPSDSL